MRVLPVNTDILLVEVDDLAQAVALGRSLAARPIPGVHEVVPAARTVMVRFHPSRVDAATLGRELLARDVSAPLDAGGELVEVPVHYDGDDLAQVAGLTGMSEAEVVARHTDSTYTVAFCGFAPGFAYLVGGDPALDVPRRSTPRTAIPAGAVGLAGPYSGVYPRVSPGGWQIIGTTDLAMFDLASEPAALLRPGMRVRFVDAGPRHRPVHSLWGVSGHAAETSAPSDVQDSPGTASGPGAASTVSASDETTDALLVERAGLGSTIQDLGRPGHADLGVSRSGALDHDAARLAARLVGDASDTASIETHGGLRLRAIGDRVLAVAGADVPVTVHGPSGTRPLPVGQAFALCAGESLEIGFPRHGAVAYVGVRGGLAVTPVLGSLATDVLSRLGPEPLVDGCTLPVRGDASSAVARIWPGLADDLSTRLPAPGDVVDLDVVLGPRTEMFSDDALELLFGQLWEVTPRSNRVGLRLHGEQPLRRRDVAELASEGTASGALQVPPNGQPVLFMADHPLTGGYPVIGSIASWHLNLAGQTPVGARIRLHPVTPSPDGRPLPEVADPAATATAADTASVRHQ